MARQFDALLSALAHGTPIDWRALEGQSWGAREADVTSGLPAAAGTGEFAVQDVGAWVVRVAWWGWAAVLSLAGLQLILAMWSAPTAVPVSGAPAPLWALAANVCLFGVAGGILLFGGRKDLRLRALGALFLLIASAFAYPLAQAGGGSTSLFLSQLQTLPVDAFVPAALWLLVWMFPTVPRSRVARGFGMAFLVASVVVGVTLLLANLPAGLAARSASASNLALDVLDRDSGRSWYWVLTSGVALPAIPFLLWKARLQTSEEQRRSWFFLAAIVGGLFPMIVAVVASIFFPATLGAPPWRLLIGSILYAALASMIPTISYAVLVDRVMEMTLSVDKATQHTFAKYGVWLVSLGPLSYLALDLYRHRELSLTEFLGNGGPVSVFVLFFVGFTALTFRTQMLRCVDRWLHGERADYTESLSRLERDMRSARSIRDATTTLGQELSRVFRPTSMVVMMRDEDGTQFVPIDGSVAPLRTDSVLAELLRAANADVRVDLGVHSRVRGLLPSSDQAWLAESRAHLVSPLVSSTGVLLGIVALGEAADGVTYEERERAAVASMCAQVALRLENVWLREHQGPASGERHLDESSRAIDWQNEPAEVCPRCSRVWPPASTTCECGARLTSAALPLLLKGQFQVERLLGSGGMGVVYLATDMALGRKVALKTLPKLSNRLAARLQQEARAMATVLHPHLALIYGADQWRGTPVLIVEYLEGGTLLDWLRRGPFTVEEALSLGIVLADVLDRLHRTGTLHRDVKPSNIGYTEDGVPKLLDLGLTAVLDGREEPAGARNFPDVGALAVDRVQGADSALSSQSNRLVGTLRYMSPEAVSGEAPRPSFDLWSLSAVLYEAMAGAHPFADLSVEDAVVRIRQGAFPDIRDACPECPPLVAAFLVDALSAVPTRRPTTAAELRASLQSLHHSLTRSTLQPL